MTAVPVREVDPQPQDLRGLVERIRRGRCILVLGPQASFQVDANGVRQTFDALLGAHIAQTFSLDMTGREAGVRVACEQYFREQSDRIGLELAIGDFYAACKHAPTPFHQDLAALPFALCLNAAPDDVMSGALRAAGKPPQTAPYNFRHAAEGTLRRASVQAPLVYHLFGHYSDTTSLVLTEGDLIEFLVRLVRGEPRVPDEVRSILADPGSSFLFLGFGFQHWYLRVLLKVLDIYGRRGNAFALEDPFFFQHPACAETVGFFSGEREVRFMALRWDRFAHQLREGYEALHAPVAPARTLSGEALTLRPPKVFVSYASEDAAAVEQLAESLAGSGLEIWQDKQSLRSGDDWERVLLDVIAHRVDYVVVLQTPAMLARVKGGVFHKEIAAALDQQAQMGEYEGLRLRFLLPTRLGACPLMGALQDLHVLDMKSPTDTAALVESINEDWVRRGRLSGRLAGTVAGSAAARSGTTTVMLQVGALAAAAGGSGVAPGAGAAGSAVAPAAAAAGTAASPAAAGASGATAPATSGARVVA